MQLPTLKDKHMKDIKGCLSHITDDWCTPSQLYDAFMDHGFIDPCPLKATFDGLQKDYYGKNLFVNPPFSQLSTWVDWCLKQVENNCNVWLLMPSRTDTKYFVKMLVFHPTIVFIEGRLHFNDTKSVAPFPTLLVNLCKGYFVNLYHSMTLSCFIDRLDFIYGKR